MFREALKGPSAEDAANVRHQLADAYVQLRLRGPVPVDSARYENHYLRNYTSLYRSRAITGLAAIGTPDAIRALEAAQDNVNEGAEAFQYRADVKDELDQAVEGRWASISAGVLFTCGIRVDGKSYCWGNNDQGQLGDGTTTGRLKPTLVANPSGAAASFRFTSIAASDSGRHTCGISTDRLAFCWGDNARGELGDSSTADRLGPTAVYGNTGFVGVAAGGSHTCAWTPEYRVFCWGANGFGQLGDGSTTDRLVPTALAVDFGSPRISAGTMHTCADSLNNVLYCWGSNGQGELGDGTNADRPSPTAAVTPVRVKSLSVGGTHTCVLAQGTSTIPDGAAYCAGNNDQGQLGEGSTTDRNELTKTVGPLYLAISAGENHTCGIAVGSRTIYCWGGNHAGQLGNDNTVNQALPGSVSAALAFVSVSAGVAHTCGITAEGQAFCWGLNADGQLGDNTTTNRLIPVKVLKP